MDKEIYEQVNMVIIGDEKVLQKALLLKNCDFRINSIKHPSQGFYEYGTIDLIQTEFDISNNDIEYGELSIDAANMAHSFIVKAIELAKEGAVDVITTSPINKEAFSFAGFTEKDHTALFKKYYGDITTTSMFHCLGLKVFHYTRHMSLKNAIAALDVDKIVRSIKKINATLKSIGISNPVIAVAALNPHASDNGMFGEEEEKFLTPAIRKCGEEGLTVEGPVPADAVFYLQRKGNYDAVLTLYHDQGHIACKTLNFERSVSLTLGLPFIRTTVDHGTAYDIAGKGLASHENLKEAILVGAEYWKLQHGLS
jgi:4-hydroxythreonine-4-phosphate dehydrogenase